jgi:hypothetical protein
MKAEEYRALAETYRAADREADAGICEIMAQERERLDRWEQRQQPIPMQDDDEEDDEQEAMPLPVATHQARLEI